VQEISANAITIPEKKSSPPKTLANRSSFLNRPFRKIVISWQRQLLGFGSTFTRQSAGP
jgi:hypothetical protein